MAQGSAISTAFLKLPELKALSPGRYLLDININKSSLETDKIILAHFLPFSGCNVREGFGSEKGEKNPPVWF